MFLLPSLPLGSASGGKTQPLLHPSPAERDERGGIMQSSWSALRPAPLTDHQHTGTAPPGPPHPRPARGSGTRWDRERGAAAAPAPCPHPHPRPLCLHPSGIPWDLHRPALPTARGDGRLARGPPALVFAMAEPPTSRGCVFALELPLPSVPAGKTLGRDTGTRCPSAPHWLQQGKGLQACAHQAGPMPGGTLPHNGALQSTCCLVNKCTGLPTAHTCHSGGWGGPTPTYGA